MQLFVLVLNKTEMLEPILHDMAQAGFGGATVLESTGMARILMEEGDMPFFGGLRNILSPERRQSNTVFVVLEDSQVDKAREIVNRVTGGIDKPDTGIMFSLPALFAEGMAKSK